MISMYKVARLTGNVRTQRLRWLGHLVRIDQSNIAKRVFERNFEGRKGGGCLKFR